MDTIYGEYTIYTFWETFSKIKVRRRCIRYYYYYPYIHLREWKGDLALSNTQDRRWKSIGIRVQPFETANNWDYIVSLFRCPYVAVVKEFDANGTFLKNILKITCEQVKFATETSITYVPLFFAFRFTSLNPPFKRYYLFANGRLGLNT